MVALGLFALTEHQISVENVVRRVSCVMGGGWCRLVCATASCFSDSPATPSPVPRSGIPPRARQTSDHGGVCSVRCNVCRVWCTVDLLPIPAMRKGVQRAPGRKILIPSTLSVLSNRFYTISRRFFPNIAGTYLTSLLSC